MEPCLPQTMAKTDVAFTCIKSLLLYRQMGLCLPQTITKDGAL